MQLEYDISVELRQEFLWRFSKYILHHSDIDWAGQHLGDLKKMSVKSMYWLLSEIWTNLVPNVRHLAQVYPELLSLAEAIAKLSLFHADVNHFTLIAQDEVLKAFSDADLWPLIIKGTAMRAYTSAPQAMNDLDLIVRNLDEAWATIKILEQRGYYLSQIKLLWLDQHEVKELPYYGYAAYICKCDHREKFIQSDWDLGRVRTVDLHIGRFHSTGEGVLFTDLWQRAHISQVNQIPALIPCVEDMIIIELAHVLRHGRLPIRNLNRICLLLGDLCQLDVGYLLDEIHRNSLTYIAQSVFRAIDTTFPHIRPLITELRSRLSLSPIWIRPAISHLSSQKEVEKHSKGNWASVLIQIYYLHDFYRRHRGYSWLSSTIAIQAFFLFRNRKRFYARAYARWRDRRRGWISRNNRAIMLTRLDRKPWLNIPENHGLFYSLAKRSITIEQTSIFLNDGEKDEILLTPVGTFTTANYAGNLPEEEMSLCIDFIKTLRRSLT